VQGQAGSLNMQQFIDLNYQLLGDRVNEVR
jgi:hypothetical protein